MPLASAPKRLRSSDTRAWRVFLDHGDTGSMASHMSERITPAGVRDVVMVFRAELLAGELAAPATISSQERAEIVARLRQVLTAARP